MSAADLAARRKVWEALCALYLDTAVDAQHAHVAAVLAQSPFPLHELRRMLLHDVHPRLAPNLLLAAGEWQSFDVDWLSEAIVQRRAQRRVSAWLTRAYPRRQWRQLLPRIAAVRASR